MVDRGAIAFCFYYILVGGVLVGHVTEPLQSAVIAGDGVPDECPVLFHLGAVHRVLKADGEAGEGVGDEVVLPSLPFEAHVGPDHLQPQPLQTAVGALVGKRFSNSKLCLRLA